MTKKLLLVDYENVHKVDLSLLDNSYSAIIFVGAKQNPPKTARKSSTAHRFKRVDFHKIEGSGTNALDFHIAFQLGRTIETAPQTECFLLSTDKSFDPLLSRPMGQAEAGGRDLVRRVDQRRPNPASRLPCLAR